jgi:hypothetical protein
MLVEKLGSSNIDLLNNDSLDKGSLLNFDNDYSNFSINPFPSRGEIKIRTVNWDKKELSYELILQGKSMGVEKAVFSKNSIFTYKSKTKVFTFSIDSVTKGADNVMTLVLYRGSLDNVPTNKYQSITLDAKSVFFNKKTIIDIIDKGKLNMPSSTNVNTNNTSVNPKVIGKAEMEQIFKDSGNSAYKKFINSKQGVDTINQVTNSVDTLVNNKQDGFPIGNVGSNPPSKEFENKEETKILGLSPITFGIISLGVIALGATLITIKLLKTKK